MFWFWIWLSKNCRLLDVSHQKSLCDRRCLIKIPQFFIQQKCFHIFYGRMSQQRQFSLERNKERLVLILLFPPTLIVMKILHLIFIHRAQDNHPAKAPVYMSLTNNLCIRLQLSLTAMVITATSIHLNKHGKFLIEGTFALVCHKSNLWSLKYLQTPRWQAIHLYLVFWRFF